MMVLYIVTTLEFYFETGLEAEVRVKCSSHLYFCIFHKGHAVGNRNQLQFNIDCQCAGNSPKSNLHNNGITCRTSGYHYSNELSLDTLYSIHSSRALLYCHL